MHYPRQDGLTPHYTYPFSARNFNFTKHPKAETQVHFHTLFCKLKVYQGQTVHIIMCGLDKIQ